MRHLLFGAMFTMLASGCGNLKTSEHNNIDWAGYNRVEIIVSTPDRWQLHPLTTELLADRGLVAVNKLQEQADLKATLEVTESFDLAETGEKTIRPRVLLLRLNDYSTDAELARSRYQLAPTQNPKHGLTLMVNDLFKHAGKAALPKQPEHSNLINSMQPALPPTLAPVATPAIATSDLNAESAAPDAANALPAPGKPNGPESTDADWFPRFKGWQTGADNTTTGETY